MAKVLVGMSGGVDSAVTAFLLKEQGYDVTGIMLRTWESTDGNVNRCCEIDDARTTAHKIDIPFYPINAMAEFEDHVIKPFVNDYMHGHTPNPCIECNKHVKWDKLLNIADAIGAEYIATGHYASVVRLDNGRYTVRKAVHAAKDQTYMLYKLTQDQLKRTLMPLGGYSKDEVRMIAEKEGLHVAKKKDSQEICFVPDGNHAGYIDRYTGGNIPPEGFFVDEEGDILGIHKGIIRYTVGQRKKLGLSLGYPAYVKSINAEENKVVIGPESSVFSSIVLCRDVNYMGMASLHDGEEVRANVKIRYQHKGACAAVRPDGSGGLMLYFDEPVKAAAPGQSAVIYDKSGCVLAGGIICSR